MLFILTYFTKYFQKEVKNTKIFKTYQVLWFLTLFLSVFWSRQIPPPISSCGSFQAQFWLYPLTQHFQIQLEKVTHETILLKTKKHLAIKLSVFQTILMCCPSHKNNSSNSILQQMTCRLINVEQHTWIPWNLSFRYILFH